MTLEQERLDPVALDEWLKHLKSIDWNVFIEGPPKGKSDPVNVLKYLARYMTGGPIADSRLISLENDVIAFRARGPNKRSGNQPGPFPLKCVEFVRRWAMHILPKGFTRTSRYGGFSGSQCDAYLQRCIQLLNIQSEIIQSSASELTAEPEPRKCARCHCELQLIQATTGPSWRVVFERLYADSSTYSPMWHIGCIDDRTCSSSTPSPPPDG